MAQIIDELIGKRVLDKLELCQGLGQELLAHLTFVLDGKS